MKCIIGLGNPGPKYANTRHNVGFMMTDYLQKKWNFEDWKDSKFQGVISEGVIGSEKIILLKPTTFMNLSGTSVVSILSYYKLDPLKDLIVVSDDIDMVFAKIRKKQSGSHGGQNGLRDIIGQIGTNEFTRIKIGIGRDERYSVSDWVLSKFAQEEIQKLEEEVFPEVESKIKESI